MKLIVLGVLLLSLQSPLLASGSCCVLSLSSHDRPTVVLIASQARSHERLGGHTYELSQHALLLKGNLPLSEHIFVSLHLGVPLSTALLSPSVSHKGTGGFLSGGGAGVVIPEIVEKLNLVMAASYIESRASMKEGGVNRTFEIREIQLSVVGEVNLFDYFGAYAGTRFYSGRNQLRGEQSTVTGIREGSVSPFAGIQFAPWEIVGFTAEATFGHTRVMSVAAALKF